MDKIEKFIAKLSKNEALTVLKILDQLELRQYQSLRLKKLKALPGLFSTRTGKIRLICRKIGDEYRLIDIDYRNKVYKNL